MAVDWSPELTINDELLDTQHVDLFRKIDETADALRGPREVLEAKMTEFADQLMAHLALEERVMDELAYPERVRHKSAHEMFVADMERMRAEVRASGPSSTVSDWVRRRLPEWLKFHIRVNDQPFAAWLLRRRAEAAAGRPIRARTDGGRRSS
jgi:hemerythrin